MKRTADDFESAAPRVNRAPEKYIGMKRLPPYKPKRNAVQSSLLNWYEAHARHFVWRNPEASSYLTLVSEVMLQQTQTTRVQSKLPEFLELFPDVVALAAADNATVIRAWSGMGYNNRALRLRDCARAIVEQHAGVIPNNYDALLALPGIGPYTAAAVCAFAFNQDIAVLDVNIRRVYSRIFWRLERSNQSADAKLTEKIAEEMYPPGQASEWHQALMDLGATICIAYQPRCEVCPLAADCLSAGQMIAERPAKRAEPSFKGQPNRIWRGKIVEILRNSAVDEWRDAFDIVEELLPPTLWHAAETESIRTWLHKLILDLQKDKLLEIRDTSRKAQGLYVRLRRQ